MLSVRHPVPKLRILVLYRSGTSVVVHDAEVGVGLGFRETHQPPAVVCRHVEAERCRDIACGSIMESYQRLAEAACIIVGETFSPELHTSLIPDLVFKTPS